MWLVHLPQGLEYLPPEIIVPLLAAVGLSRKVLAETWAAQGDKLHNIELGILTN